MRDECSDTWSICSCRIREQLKHSLHILCSLISEYPIIVAGFKSLLQASALMRRGLHWNHILTGYVNSIIGEEFLNE